MTLHYSDDAVTLHHGDCLDVLAAMPDNSVDSVVCDPPYGLEFMGKEWDKFGVGKQPKIGKPDGSKFRQNMGTPSFTDAGNPTCRNCRGDKYRNGPRKCSCPAPNFGNPQAESMRGFQQWCQQWAAECLRVLKPGGHMLAFGGTRTWHRLACAVEDAGFEVRDSIAWLYGSGFPKSLDVSKAIDKVRTEDLQPAADVAKWLVDQLTERGLTRRDVSEHFGAANIAQQWTTHWIDGAVKPRVPSVEQWAELRVWLDLPDTMDAEVWRLNGRKGKPGDAFDTREVISSREVQDIRNGHGRALGGAMFAGEETGKIEHKTTAPATPAAQQWQGWGTALKPAFEPIVVARKPLVGTVAANVQQFGTGALNVDGCRVEPQPGDYAHPGNDNRKQTTTVYGKFEREGRQVPPHSAGRWPANVLLDGSQADALDEQSGTSTSRIGKPRGADSGDGWRMTATGAEYADEGGASRFFPTFRYEAKAPTFERPRDGDTAHPTVKPLDLLRWLVRLVTPPGGVVLDPFAGTGTTGEACIVEGVRAVLIEREADYLPLIVARLSKPIQPDLFGIDGESA